MLGRWSDHQKRVAAGVPPVKSHVPGWWLTCFIFHFIYGMSSFPLTNSIIFQRGRHTANQCTYEAFLKWGIPETMGFNTKSCSNDLDDLGVPPWLRKPPYEIPWCKRLHRCGLHMVFRSNDRQAAREVSGPHGWSLWDGYLTLVHPHFNPYPWWFMKLAFLPYRMIFVLSSLHKSHKSLMTCVFQKTPPQIFCCGKNGRHEFEFRDAPFPKYLDHWRSYSYGHLLVITGYKWDYTFYKWGYKYL